MVVNNKDIYFKYLTEKISEVDFTGYTAQYPPMVSWKIVKEWEVRRAWKNLTKKEQCLGLYIHFPYCKSRCSFCRYLSYEIRDYRQIDEYLKFLDKEIKIYKSLLGCHYFRTLYIGGGSPSLMSPEQLERFFDMIYSNFNMDKCIQINFEGNADFLGYDKLKILKNYGVSRLTIGVQSLDKAVIRRNNRTQNPNLFYKIYEDARKIGIKYINIDLMAGLPGQSFQSFHQTLNRVINLKPDMVHVHPFYPTAYTEFMRGGDYLSKKCMELRNRMSIFAQDMMSENGYKNIKFDASGKHDEAKNIQLSDAIEHVSSYLGLGLGAVSHIRNKFRYVNFDNTKNYFLYLLKNQLPVMKGVSLNKDDEMIYYVTTCLRYGEVSKTDFYNLFDCHLKEVFKGAIEYLEERNIIIEQNDNFVMRSNNIGEYLIFSKYFYDKNLIRSLAYGFSMKERELKDKNTKYMLL